MAMLDDLEQVSSDDDNKWIIVTFHRPPFTSGGKGTEDIREYLCPLFDQYGVDLVLAGHMHVYERFYPLDQTGKVMDYNSSFYDDPPVPIYIVDGCAGAPQYSSYPKDWTAYMEKEFGYSRISISHQGTLHFEHLRVEGGQRSVVDDFIISKEDARYRIEDNKSTENKTTISGTVILVAAIVIVIIGIVCFVLWFSMRDRDRENNSMEINESSVVTLNPGAEKPATREGKVK